MDGVGPKVAINGFGRIGRIVTRILLQMDKEGTPVDLVGINDLTDKHTLAHLFRYDSVHGRFRGNVEETEDGLILDGDRLRVFAEPKPENGLWRELQPDILIEASGHYTSKEALRRHLQGGAKAVIVTAPAETELMVVRGVNDDQYDKTKHRTISNASCTTNCLALVVKVLHDAFGVESGLMTTIHAATNDQRVVDAPHKDLRRARASLVSMIPTSTGAAKAIGKIIPELDGRIDGQAVRVPTTDVSLVDLVVRLGGDVTRDEVLDAFRAAEKGPLAGLLGVSDEPLVSVDYLGDARSAIIDAPSLQVQGDLVKVLAWYDNEWGYASRVAELVHQMAG